MKKYLFLLLTISASLHAADDWKYLCPLNANGDMNVAACMAHYCRFNIEGTLAASDHCQELMKAHYASSSQFQDTCAVSTLVPEAAVTTVFALATAVLALKYWPGLKRNLRKFRTTA